MQRARRERDACEQVRAGEPEGVAADRAVDHFARVQRVVAPRLLLVAHAAHREAAQVMRAAEEEVVGQVELGSGLSRGRLLRQENACRSGELK